MYFKGTVSFKNYVDACRFTMAADKVFEKNELTECRNEDGNIILSVQGKVISEQFFEKTASSFNAVKHNMVYEEAAA